MHQLFFGGSRSGKTFAILRAIVIRALKIESRHVVTRFRFNHCKESIGMDTLPKLMGLCYPDVPYELNKSDWFIKLPNGSEIWLGGLDDKDRTEKILGKEFASIFFNECSQIPWGSVEIALTRLAQKTGLPLRAYYDENPPDKGHWSYKLFVLKMDPVTGAPRADPENYRWLRMVPEDNAENLAPEALNVLRNLSGRRRKRFLDGEFGEANPNALWSSEVFEKYRILNEPLPDFQRIGIAVDPSGSGDEDNAENDAIGIVVGALGTDGRAYVLEDLTLKTGPAAWGAIVGSAYDRHKADFVVGETNFGGAMVKHVIETARPGTPFREAKATRGKVVRAEPISALYEQGKVRHVGHFPELEDELQGFTTTGYTGGKSPNRADALVWLITSFFPGLVKEETKIADPHVSVPHVMQGPGGWLAG